MTHPALLALLAAPLCSAANLGPLATTSPSQEGAATPVEASAPQAGQEPASQPGPIPLMTMGMGDLTKGPVHPKDAALVRALGWLDERLAELPSELGRDLPRELQPAFEADSIPVWLRLLTAQKRFAISALGAPPQRGQMPFLMSVAVDEASDEAAARYEGALKGLLQRMQAPFPMEMIQREGSALQVNMGAELAPMGHTRAAQMLGSEQPSFEMEMNVGGYLRFVQGMMMDSGAPYEAMVVFDVLSRMGLDNAVIEVASSGDGTTSQTASILTGIGGRMKAAGILPEGGLTAAHLAPVPADATWASVQRMDMEAVFDAINALAGEYMKEQMGDSADIAETVKGLIGIDLRSGLFGALGDTYGMYASESTGGGGISSTVLFFSLRDSEALLETKEQLEEVLNGIAAGETDGYVNIRSWTRGDDEYTTVMFPGLPIPFEPTMAMGENWLVIAATPQAAMGAMDQIAGSGPSLATKPSVARIVADGTKSGVSFMDGEHFAREGYGLTSMMFSSVSNGVRSRMDAMRDPGPVMPVYHVFQDGIQDTVGYSELQGDDLITRQTSDGSIVVQTAILTGFMTEYGTFILLPAVLAAGAPQFMRNF
ncbi:hypothetical protein Poly30_17180 [Planctomycetes bacterium Poly30]|uniref:DUF3352 domain-containing protein n=1 Tax=Saltatorellus ferox TaxID=2528018 RepID=A0A518EQ64_9BACT|nr:hypothetical protein Poly30_17180 [Planctomycetes bacterium Poly30]